MQKSTLLPGMVEWTVAQENKDKVSCSFGCGYLFLDVCGFTKLTELVSSKGHYGVEVITNLLNQYFDLLNDKIAFYGGQILKFEGDAILAAFPLPKETCLSQMEKCMAEFRIELDTLNASLVKMYGSSLAYHGSMGFGDSQMIILGNPEIHLDYFVYSPVMAELYKLCDHAGHNETLKVEGVSDSANDVKTPCVLLSIPQYAGVAHDDQFFPREIINRGLSDTFSGELRNSAILFIGVEAEHFIRSNQYSVVNSYYCAIQEIVFRLEGMVNKIDYTDKGMILLISFGILQTHVDDIERAIICANQINRIDSPLKAKIGLTYSNLYAGVLGAKTRHEYGIIGNGVNVAARLMTSAEYGQIVFTKDILGSVESRFEVQFLRKTVVKGIKGELEFYRITREMPEYVNSYIKQFHDKKQVCYLDETAEIISRIEGGKLNQVLISGEHGTGKSFLGWQILSKFYAGGKRIAVFVMDEYNRHDRLILLRKLICKGLACEDLLGDADRLHSYLIQFIPERDTDLLMGALGHTRAETHLVDDTGKQKDLLILSLLKSFEVLSRDYDFILLDNVQWMDDLSSAILKKRMEDKEAKPLTLIQTLIPTTVEENYQAAPNNRTAVLSLGDLEHNDVFSLIKSRIPNITHQAGDYIFALAGGNPRFIVELCVQINSLFPDPDMLITAPNIQEIQNKGLLPYSVENLFMIKYEALSQPAKEILKKASIVGKGFTLNEIIETQDTAQSEMIAEVIAELKDKDIIDVTDLAPEVQYLFSNVLMRQAVYGTILLSEKKDLHNRIADFYEDKYGGNAVLHSELLAYHYHLGENDTKALSYSLHAARQNQSINNHGEAVYYYQMALQHTKETAQQISIALCIVDSQYYLGELESAIETLGTVQLELVSDSETESKYHFLQCRAHYLSGDYEAMLNYLEPITAFSGKYGEQMQLYKLDGLLKIYKVEEFRKEWEIARQSYTIEAAKALGVKAKQPTLSLLLKRFVSLKPEMVSEAPRHYLYLLLKLEAIAVNELFNTGYYAKAEKSLAFQYDLAKALKDDLSMRIASNGLGSVYTRMGKLDKAYQAYVEAITIADKISDRFGYAKVLSDLATLHRRMGNHDRAMQNFKRSLKMFEAMGNLYFQGIVLHGIGEIYHQEGKMEDALKYFRKALRIAQKSGDLIGVSIERDAIGDYLYTNNRIEEAKALYLKNLKHQHKIGDREGIAHTHGNLGNVAKAEKDFAKAMEHYALNIKMTAEIGDTDGNGRGYFNLAGLYEELGDIPKAIENMTTAKEKFEQAGSVRFIQLTEERLKKYLKSR